MGSKSKRKGKVGEREAAKELSRLFRIDAKRGVQYQGGPESPDVVGLPGIHVEVKRCEALSIYTAMDQAVSDAGDNVPTVLHRRNGKPWLFVCRLDDLPAVCVNGFHTLGMQ